MPVYDNAVYEFNNSEDIALAFQSKKTFHSYSHSSNPAVEHFVQKVKNITGVFFVYELPEKNFMVKKSFYCNNLNFLLNIIDSSLSI